jgi:hypothetical protein
MSSPLDQDRVVYIEVSIVCTKRLVSTRYVPHFRRVFYLPREGLKWKRALGRSSMETNGTIRLRIIPDILAGLVVRGKERGASQG